MEGNYYPNGYVITKESKRELLNIVSKEFQVDAAIRPVVDAINNTNLFLTNSSCEGQNGDPSSPHLPDPYVGIGVLYNELNWLERFAYEIKEAFLDEVDCSFNYDTRLGPVETGDELAPVFRPFLRLNIYERGMFPKVIQFIEEFARQLPDTQPFSHEHYVKVESSLSEKVEEKIVALSALHDEDDFDECFAALLTLLRPYAGKVEDNGVIHIQFYCRNRKLEDLFRLLTFKAQAETLHAYATIRMDQDGSFFNEIDLHLSDLFAFPVITEILKEFLASPDGELMK